jgi:hypothetical protein
MNEKEILKTYPDPEKEEIKEALIRWRGCT